MATYYLINTVTSPDGTKHLAGSVIDDAVYDVPALIASGAELEPSSNTYAAAGSAKALAAHLNRGADEEQMEDIMRSALDTGQAASLGAVPSPAITAPADVTRAAAVIGVGTAYARTDHKHDVSVAAPVSVGTANATGAASSLAASNHVHDHGAQSTGTHHAAATIAVAGFMSATDKTRFDTMQAGTGTLVAGTATIAANITALSRIQVTMKDPGAGAITGFAAFKVPAAARVVGAPGSFDVTAIDDAKATIATAVCTFDWHVEN